MYMHATEQLHIGLYECSEGLFEALVENYEHLDSPWALHALTVSELDCLVRLADQANINPYIIRERFKQVLQWMETTYEVWLGDFDDAWEAVRDEYACDYMLESPCEWVVYATECDTILAALEGKPARNVDIIDVCLSVAEDVEFIAVWLCTYGYILVIHSPSVGYGGARDGDHYEFNDLHVMHSAVEGNKLGFVIPQAILDEAALCDQRLDEERARWEAQRQAASP